MIGTHTDITQGKEEALNNSKLAQMVEQTNDSLISTDLNGIIDSWNQGSQKLFGYTKEEAIGKSVFLMLNQADSTTNTPTVKELIDALQMGTVIRNEMIISTKSGKKIPISYSLSSLVDEHGKIIGVVGYNQDISERIKMEKELAQQKQTLELYVQGLEKKKEELDYQAHHDSLTSLPNRILFSDRLHQAIEKAKRQKGQVAVLFIDLDHFKEINDSLGHNVGDSVLQAVSTKLIGALREEDTLARLGGDEFTVVIESINQIQDFSLIAEKLLQALAEPIEIQEYSLYVSSSIGISIYPDDGQDINSLLKYADSAMYKAKEEGRNNFQYYNSSLTEIAFERVVMETSLRMALKEEQFVVYYQAQVDGRTNTIVGMEALVRWEHPTMGLVSPIKFIPLAESTGLIIELDRYVMKTAMSQMSQWYKEGLNPGILAMNLAVKQLQQKDFLSTFKEFIKECGCRPDHLALEVTESQIMKNPEEAILTLQSISDLGIELAVDDFGTGYSSLTYLKRLPINKLKIDQEFIHDLPNDEEDAAITRAVIALANSLNLKVIAEGVETQEQKEFVVANGCHDIQGYFYSKPIPADEFRELLIKMS